MLSDGGEYEFQTPNGKSNKTGRLVVRVGYRRGREEASEAGREGKSADSGLVSVYGRKESQGEENTNTHTEIGRQADIHKEERKEGSKEGRMEGRKEGRMEGRK